MHILIILQETITYPTMGSWENHPLKSGGMGWDMLVPGRVYIGIYLNILIDITVIV